MTGSSSAVIQPRLSFRAALVPLLVVGLILLADQFSKQWVLTALGPEPESREILLVGDWLSFLYVRNTGVAFGLFQNASQIFVFTSLLITAAIIVTYILYLPNRLGWLQLCVGLIVGGALGNVIDRLRYGYVIDFIKVGWWPIFNIADSAVTVGITMLALFLAFFEEEAVSRRPMPRDDALLSELLSHDVDSSSDSDMTPSRRVGRTDSGRVLSDDE
jgi:signal peptidase II